VERAGHIAAIEIDRDLAGRLRAEFLPTQLTLIEGDALAFDWEALPGRLRLVGKLPYNISSPLLFSLSRASPPPGRSPLSRTILAASAVIAPHTLHFSSFGDAVNENGRVGE